MLFKAALVGTAGAEVLSFEALFPSFKLNEMPSTYDGWKVPGVIAQNWSRSMLGWYRRTDTRNRLLAAKCFWAEKVSSTDELMETPRGTGGNATATTLVDRSKKSGVESSVMKARRPVAELFSTESSSMLILTPCQNRFFLTSNFSNLFLVSCF